MRFSGVRYFTLLCLLLACTPQAFAHRLLVFPDINGEHIVIHASFGRNAPAVGAAVTVYAADEQILIQGHTDERGRFRFSTPPPQTLRIVVDDGAGHRNEQVITAERIAHLYTVKITTDPPIIADETNGDRSEQGQLLRFALGLAILLSIAACGWWWSRRSP